jgi:hypothetical protein
MKVSICIPTWEQYGNGTKFLSHLLDTITVQNYKNFNVVISDHSKDGEIEKLIDGYKNLIEIKYVKFNEKHGNSPANTNNAIINSDGDIIKIMFQDDFFYDSSSIEKIVNSFKNNNVNWVVNGCNHTNDGINFHRTMVPHWNDSIVFGNNTISSPSVLSFRKNSGCFFDENLVMFMDCEMYYQLYKKFGLPTIIEDTLITNRMHENQISSRYDKNLLEEIHYIKYKHKI